MELREEIICPICHKGFHLYELHHSPSAQFIKEFNSGFNGFFFRHLFCPCCAHLIIYLVECCLQSGSIRGDVRPLLIYPKASPRVIPPEVPNYYASEYKEAEAVMDISLKASAALSRRLLQVLLREKCKIKPSKLYPEIEEFIKRPGVPGGLASQLNAIREIGNFAAHPSKNSSTGEIAEVEEGEAEWLLNTLESFFDYLFVRPKLLESNLVALNSKLKSVNRPPIELPVDNFPPK